MRKNILFVLAIALVTVACKTTPDTESEAKFKHISVREIQGNPIKMIADDWGLVTAKDGDKFSLMTVNWGAMGNLWGEPVAFVFIHPDRYTYDFTENDKYFTITVFEEKYHDILLFCGQKSGRDIDKIKETGLTPLTTELGNIYYEQARLVIECQKIYANFMNEDAFIDKTIMHSFYPSKVFHKMYIGKILNVWVKE